MPTKFPGADEVLASIKAATIVHFQLGFDTPTGTYTIPVPAGTFVHVVGTVVSEVFDATTPTLTVGDGDDVDGYLDNTDIALGTALTVTTPAVKLAEDGGNPYANGKYYPTADTIDFIWDDGTSGTTGQLKGFVIMSNVKLDGLDAGLTA